MPQPKLSVVMPVYNAAPYLREAIESVLNQTFSDFEFIIIDDGSKDESAAIINSYSDARIQHITHEKNQGLIATLNEGVELAKAPYVARMDPDDISKSTRLEKQYAYLSTHAKVVAVGTDATVISTDGRKLYEQVTIQNNEALQLILAVACPFVHGSVMFRKTVVEAVGGYRKEAYTAEDYDLWVRLAKDGELANLKESLYRYRYNPAGESQTKSVQQKKMIQQIADRVWAEYKKEGPAPRSVWPIIWSPDVLAAQPVADHQRQLAHFHIYFARGYFRHGAWGMGVQHLIGAWQIAPLTFSFYFYYITLPLLPDATVTWLEGKLVRVYAALRGWR